MSSDLPDNAKRLANQIETKVAEILPQLLAESRTREANNIMHHVDFLVRALRGAAEAHAA